MYINVGLGPQVPVWGLYLSRGMFLGFCASGPHYFIKTAVFDSEYRDFVISKMAIN
jgi:hypothetical protein